MTAPASLLAQAAGDLRRAALRCSELAHDSTLDAPLVTRLIERVAALADELCWELAAADPVPPTPASPIAIPASLGVAYPGAPASAVGQPPASMNEDS